MSFSLEYALANAERILNERRSNSAKRLTYVLYYAHNAKRYDGKIEGYTIKELIAEFRLKYGNYKIAFITKIGDDKVLRYHNADRSKKFFSLTRSRKTVK